MTNRRTMITLLALTTAALLLSAVCYGRLADQVPVHWGLDGQPDGWVPRSVGALLGPGIMALLSVLLLLLPAVSPRNFSTEGFRPTYNYLAVLVVGLMGYIHVVTLAAGMGLAVDPGRVLIIGIMLFLAAIGNVLGKVRRNFWMGVRTPWTLASDRVWIATHRLAARLMVAAGLLGALLVLLGLPPAVSFGLLMAAVLAPAVYSLVLYRRLERDGELE